MCVCVYVLRIEIQVIVDAGETANGKGEPKNIKVSEQLRAGKMGEEAEYQQERQGSHPPEQKGKKKG